MRILGLRIGRRSVTEDLNYVVKDEKVLSNELDILMRIEQNIGKILGMNPIPENEKRNLEIFYQKKAKILKSTINKLVDIAKDDAYIYRDIIQGVLFYNTKIKEYAEELERRFRFSNNEELISLLQSLVESLKDVDTFSQKSSARIVQALQNFNPNSKNSNIIELIQGVKDVLSQTNKEVDIQPQATAIRRKLSSTIRMLMKAEFANQNEAKELASMLKELETELDSYVQFVKAEEEFTRANIEGIFDIVSGLSSTIQKDEAAIKELNKPALLANYKSLETDIGRGIKKLKRNLNRAVGRASGMQKRAISTALILYYLVNPGLQAAKPAQIDAQAPITTEQTTQNSQRAYQNIEVQGSLMQREQILECINRQNYNDQAIDGRFLFRYKSPEQYSFTASKLDKKLSTVQKLLVEQKKKLSQEKYSDYVQFLSQGVRIEITIARSLEGSFGPTTNFEGNMALAEQSGAAADHEIRLYISKQYSEIDVNAIKIIIKTLTKDDYLRLIEANAEQITNFHRSHSADAEYMRIWNIHRKQVAVRDSISQAHADLKATLEILNESGPITDQSVVKWLMKQRIGLVSAETKTATPIEQAIIHQDDKAILPNTPGFEMESKRAVYEYNPKTIQRPSRINYGTKRGGTHRAFFYKG